MLIMQGCNVCGLVVFFRNFTLLFFFFAIFAICDLVHDGDTIYEAYVKCLQDLEIFYEI